jgi:hypothetical protein
MPNGNDSMCVQYFEVPTKSYLSMCECKTCFVVEYQVKMSKPAEMDGLMDAKAYAKHLEEADH